MRSPIKYFGGKIYMQGEIQSCYPSNLYDYTFVEGFGGGASALFAKPPFWVEVYNDLDENLYALFKVLQDNELFAVFKSKLDLTPYSKQIRQEFKDSIKQDNIDLVTRAFMFFYINRTSFNGVGGFCTNLSVRRNMSKAVSDYLSMVDYLPEIHDRISRVIIEKLDILELLDKYNKPSIFFYLDPPYVHSTRKSTARYNVEMTDDQHRSMIEAIINHSGKSVISGYDNPIYDPLLDNGFNKKNFKSPSSESIETVWFNT